MVCSIAVFNWASSPVSDIRERWHLGLLKQCFSFARRRAPAPSCPSPVANITASDSACCLAGRPPKRAPDCAYPPGSRKVCPGTAWGLRVVQQPLHGRTEPSALHALGVLRMWPEQASDSRPGGRPAPIVAATGAHAQPEAARTRWRAAPEHEAARDRRCDRAHPDLQPSQQQLALRSRRAQDQGRRSANPCPVDQALVTAQELLGSALPRARIRTSTRVTPAGMRTPGSL